MLFYLVEEFARGAYFKGKLTELIYKHETGPVRLTRPEAHSGHFLIFGYLKAKLSRS